MRGLILVGLTVLTLSPAKAEVDHDSAGYIFPHCKADKPLSDGDAYLGGLCDGIIKTIADLSGVVCANGVSLDEETRVVIKYISERPKIALDFPFVTLATMALTDAWPCTPEGAKGERAHSRRGPHLR